MDVLKKNAFPRKSDLFEKTLAVRSLNAQLSDKQPGLGPHDGYRHGRAGDAPLIAKLGGNGVGRRPDQSAQILCLKFETHNA